MVAEKRAKPDNENILEINGLSSEYRTLEGTVYAVNGVDLELKKGGSIGLVGETGAGKTTTVMSILRLLPKQGIITGGEILFENKDLVRMKEEELRGIRGNDISMIFQDPMSSLNPVYSVKNQIAETVKIHQKVSKQEANARALEMMRAVGISEDRAEDYPYEFSGGMIQRVMIAIALSCQPKLLIADEPTTALDVTIQAQVMDIIKNLRKDFNTSMILITHDLGIVPEVCDSVAIMYAGRIVEQGSIRAVYTSALHPYTSGLFSCVPDIEFPDKKLFPIMGLSPNARALPGGCPFHPRCTKRMDKCSESVPKLIELEGSHKVACWLHEK